ncbi:MAG: hypothetical protein JWO76_1182 [Nocardioides sp.]|nr:hypothetical protein [Nocardioides sp.]
MNRHVVRWSALVATTAFVVVAAGTSARPGTPTPGLFPASSPGSEPPFDAVTTEAGLRAAWADPLRQRIDLGADIVLRNCHVGDPIRESPYPLVLDGHGFTIRQSCFEKRLLRQDGTGYLDIRDVTLTRGGSDGPGAALTSRGEIMLSDCAVKQNLAEEPGGGVFSMRRVTAYRCHINGNLANDDGGGIYARRGGVQVYDSVLSTNLVDGSGGAIGSTGDILVVRSRVDGNTTDGDGGALYADEDGDVTVINSLIDGSDADGPGGAIFTLDGDVAVLDSTLVGNRADDRGGAISGEADVLVVDSTVARNLAVAHAGGGIWARGNVVLVNSTVTNNYAEGAGGGVLAAGRTTLVSSTITRNIASVGGDLGSSGTLRSFSSIIGPPQYEGVTGDTIPTRRSCRVYEVVSQGHNFVTEPSCGLTASTDVTDADPMLAQLEDDPLGFVLTPSAGSPVRARVPSGSCSGTLPDPLPAAQLLDAWVDWSEVLTHDATGRLRDTGEPCDIGAVQSAPSASPRFHARIPAPGRRALTGPSPDRARTAHRTPRAVAPRARPRSLHDLRLALGRLGHRLDRLARDAGRFRQLLDCTTNVGVDRSGDRQHRWGFLYDERDGTGLDSRPALVRHHGSDPAWRLLRLSTTRRCLSAAPDPNGSGDDARPARPRPPAGVRRLLHTLHRLERHEERVDAATERFDAWESCVSWLPVTEAGDAEQDLGYLVDEGLWPYRRVHYPAIDLDHSEWDDPDYQLLAFRGKDHPFGPGECGTDPGEAPDRPHAGRHGHAGHSEAMEKLRSGVRSLGEDVADLLEPVDEITRFDECMYTVGVRESPGYLYRDSAGSESRRPALSFDLRGDQLPQLGVMAFPGEEPPQIECNEDAGGVETDE